MGFDKRKELYWVAAILLSTFITGILVFGEALWDGQPVDIQLHDTYFVLKDRIYTAYTNGHDTLVHEYDLKNHRGTYLDNKQFLRNDLTFQQTGPGRWLYRQK